MSAELGHITTNQIELSARADAADRAIEYPGKLRFYDYFNGCGAHPQFQHLKTPPSGYYFVDSEKRRSSWLFTAFYAARLAWQCLKSGASWKTTLRFIRTRGLKWQHQMGGGKAEAFFFPSVPFHLNQFRWTVEIEDAASLLYPFIQNGQTGEIGMETLGPIRPVFRSLLGSDKCRAVISHMKSTAENLPVLLGAPELKKKVFYVPLGIPAPDWMAVTAAKSNKGPGPRFLFSNSWHQHGDGFYLRGGLDVLETFARIREQIPNAQLTLRTALPADLPQRYQDLIREHGVKVVSEFLTKEDWFRLRAESDYFLFPSARIHIVSFLEAMAFGMCVVTSDGWGIEEYVRHNENGIVIPARSKVAWMDKQVGLLREDYSKMRTSDPLLCSKMADAVIALENNPQRRASIVNRARRDIDEVYTLENWNNGLKRIFDLTI